MEEDTGKSLHVGGATGRIHGADYSLVDYNRAGIPLIEIVTKPIRGTREQAPLIAKAYVAQLRELIVALGVSDARMDQGSMRADVNLSLAPEGDGGLGTRTETKNVNSLRSVERAVRYEMQRHAAVLQTRRARSSRRPGTGTRTPGSPPAGVRSPTPRTTATSPSPTWSRSHRRGSGSRSCGARCPSPRARSGRGCRPTGASPTSRCATPSVPARSGLVEETIAAGATPQAARKWWLSEMARRANDSGVEIAELGVTPAEVAAGPGAGRRRRASTTSWPARSSTACSPVRARRTEIVAARGLAIVSDDGALGAAVDNAIAANPDVADKIRDGKVAAAGALIGAVMKEMRGQADAGRVRELILEKLCQ